MTTEHNLLLKRILMIIAVIVIGQGCQSAQIIQKDGRNGHDVLQVRGQLIVKTDVSNVPWEDVRLHPSFTAVCIYRLEKTSEDVMIVHWAVVNGMPLRSYSELQIGCSYELLLRPLSAVQYMEEYPRYCDSDDLDKEILRMRIYASERVDPFTWRLPESQKQQWIEAMSTRFIDCEPNPEQKGTTY
jgi:hypothetical protein